MNARAAVAANKKAGATPALVHGLTPVRPSSWLCPIYGPTSVSPKRGHDFNEVRVHSSSPPVVQTKLSIGEPGDRYEREADEVASRVMGMPTPVSGDSSSGKEEGAAQRIERQRRQCGRRIQRDTEEPYAIEDGVAEEEKDQEALQAREWPGHTPRLWPGIESRIGALRSGGRPLPDSLRVFMEPRFGHDFGSVRIHTGNTAVELAASIHARAFALGPDLVFGANQYAPETETGRLLLAHELTHSIQQGHATRLSAPEREIDSQPAGPGSKLHSKPSDEADEIPEPGITDTATDFGVVRRVVWSPNTDTGKKRRPWKNKATNGKVLKAKTDAGAPIEIWKPDDGQTYWCHGFTFGGKTAPGGPYSLWGQDVPMVLKDDGWQPQTDSCAAKSGDAIVFEGNDPISHSGVIGSVSGSGGSVDESASTLDSKWGDGPQNTRSWEVNAGTYGMYRCYSKSPTLGHCRYRGLHEAGEALPLPPGDFPAPSGGTRVA